MILASLARYYRSLAAETDDMGNPKVPPYGFSEEKIGWILVLDKEGRLKTAVPNLTADKKPQPKPKKNRLRRLKKLLTPSSNTILIYCKTATMKACKPYAVFCKTGSLHISLPKICLLKCSMPTSHFLLKNRPHLSINAKPRKPCGQAA